MHDLYDRLENRPPSARETALFRDLAHVLSVSKSRVPALRAQLKGIDLAKLRTRADLTRVPIRRRGDLLASQAETPPFGGYSATRIAALAQIFLGSDDLCSLSGTAKDWWSMARALYAAGLRKGELVLNACSYDLVPDGHMVESGARAIGCPVVPAGKADAAAVAAVASRLKPTFFCGRADQLKRVLDHGEAVGSPPSTIARALVTGSLKHGLRSELTLRGIHVRHAAMIPELGVIAYESGTTEGLTLAEGLLLEIIDPSDGSPVAPGCEGEIVLSRINLDYPLLRYGTGLISSVIQQPSSCGRTNTRIATPYATCEPDITHISEIRKRHPDLTMRLWTMRPHGAPLLKVEHRSDEPKLRELLDETLRVVTRQRGTVEIVRPGTLIDDDALVGDEHPAGRH